METGTFYTRFRGQVAGPYTREQLALRVAAGHLTGVHSVSVDRQTWIQAKQLDWLFSPTVNRAPTSLGQARQGPDEQPPALPPRYIPTPPFIPPSAPPPPAPRRPAPMPAAFAPFVAAPPPAVDRGPKFDRIPPAAPTGDRWTPDARAHEAAPAPSPAPSRPRDAGPGDAPARPSPPPGAGKTVFVSHSSQNFSVASEIVAALEAEGVTCWIAPRDIPAGSDYNHQIMTGLQQCRMLLLVYSRYSVDSDPVQREVERAKSRGVPIVSVRIEPTKPSPALEYMISNSQWIDAHPPPLKRHLEKIVARMKAALDLAGTQPAGPEESKYVGKFTLLEQLGEGGMGVVFKAEQREPVKRIVAVKLIKPGFDTAEVVARFSSEQQALARMNHPNIAKVLEAGTDGQGRPYFVMEYVNGIPITEFADSRKLSIRARLDLFLQVCSAIAHAHTKAIIHRDIKAGNVLAFMKDDRPAATVIDFGIAKALFGERLTDRTLNTSVGKVLGTYACMSPEQAEGSPDVDARSDVYSLGVLLYELLTGAKPFDPKTLDKVPDAEARRIIREDEPPRPSTQLTTLGPAATRVALARQLRVDSLARELRGELGWIPLMAMRKEPERRYPSPLLMAEDIQNYIHSRPLMAGPESKTYRFRKFARRNRVVLTVVIGSLIAIAAGAYAHIVSIGRAERAAVQQEQIAKQQQKIARKEELVAKTVNQFLSEMLTSANPKKGNELTILDAIKVFIKGLDTGRLKDQPAVEASIRDTIGDVLRSLGDSAADYDVADDNLQLAISKYHEARPNAPDGPEIARVLDHQGHLAKDRGKNLPKEEAAEAAKEYKKALDDYDEALAIYRVTPPDDVSDLATVLIDRALLLLQKKQDLGTAEQNCRESLSIRQNRPNPNPGDVLQCMGALIDILREEALARHKGSTEFPKADAVVEQGTGLVALLDPDERNDPIRARFLWTKGSLLSAEKKFGAAAEAFRTLYEIDKKTYAPGHHYRRDALKKLNVVLKEMGQPQVKPTGGDMPDAGRESK